MNHTDESAAIVPCSTGKSGTGYHHQPPKTIGFFGSLCLVCNNNTGPAMMGLPLLFRTCGIIPTVLCIILVWVLSSLSGSMLSETIQKLPGNRHFDQNVDFSQAFSSVVGKRWFVVVECLVILACIVNACVGLVEVAQALDSFLASYVLGSTWGVQVAWDTLQIVEWDSSRCISSEHHESKTSHCTPFHNIHDNVISLGYLLCFLCFYPLGRNDLKETMLVQKISFVFFFILLVQFLREFDELSFKYMDKVPMWGGDFSKLAGVVLFNYAYPITIPSWLNEKKHSVPVNKIIWLSSFIATVVYILFGILAAGTFNSPGEDILVVLASKKCSSLTRVAAASFGVAIIGSGVPVFCVIVRNQLLHSGVFNDTWSKFLGTLGPYLISWYMYQGKTLMIVFNWAGLLVNGMIAFILPLVLALVAYRTNYGIHDSQISEANNQGGLIAMTSLASARTSDPKPYIYESISADSHLPSDSSIHDKDVHKHTHNDSVIAIQDAADVASGPEDSELVEPLYSCLEPFRGPILVFGTCTFCFMIVFTVLMDILTGAGPS